MKNHMKKNKENYNKKKILNKNGIKKKDIFKKC